jgi:hypothetical protein
MKIFNYISIVITFLSIGLNAQQNTVITANTAEISDHLDLRAVASIFGESADLADFERRLNDPSLQISNLDLNQDNQVDYLRVVEIVDGNLHLIVLQAALSNDLLQDVATIEVERENRTQNVQIQIVGNSFFYGSNYIYEPIYVHRPIMFNNFWRPNYVAYYSPWHWGYYPAYFYALTPYPFYRYNAHIGYYVNLNNHCNFVNYRRNDRFATIYNPHFRGGYERQHPNRSFSARNTGYTNRNEMRQNSRSTAGRSSLATTNRNSISNRNAVNNRSVSGRSTTATRSTVASRNTANRNTTATRSTIASRNIANRNTESVRNNSVTTRSSQNNSITPSTRNNSSNASSSTRSSSNRSQNTSVVNSSAPARSASTRVVSPQQNNRLRQNSSANENSSSSRRQ